MKTKKTLVIVESPTKAKTISKYLGSDFEIRASVGHVRDLPKNNRKAIDIPGGFIPHYEIVKGKEAVVDEIRKLSKKSSTVLLATDPDREGESIAWHIREACGLTDPKRVVFHEITEPAIREALTHPRDIDLNLLKAQEARRVLDRLVGYDLSGLIWKKVRYGLSAGRVQSPALRILMEREREIRAFVPEKFWTIAGTFAAKGNGTLLLTCEEEPRDFNEVERILAAARANPWTAGDVKQTEVARSPRPPFTTSTLQQAASSRLGFSPSRTMGVAQKLYEEGFITYMRTDSMTVSREALGPIFGAVESEFGKEYLSPRTYKTRSKTAQEAHEAIRPTDARKRSAGTTEEQRRLYDLIRARTLASQMADAKLLRTKIIGQTASGEAIPPFSATGSIVVFPGWLAADPAARGEDVELPALKKGTPLTLKDIASTERETEPPARYTEAGLVKELEKREIGRPSTYASIIRTIVTRGYVEKAGRTLIPTDTGDVVSSFLEENFAKYISDSFTAEMENDLDEIADGKRDYTKTLADFYGPFTKDVKSKENIPKITGMGDAPDLCPVCGGPMEFKLSRTGKFMSCKKFPTCMGARKSDGTVMEGPKETGETCPQCKDGKLVLKEGRFGKFIACSNYPKCKFIKTSPEEEEKRKTGVKCPDDGSPRPGSGEAGGEIIERRGRFGPFFSCSNYPKCRFIMKAKPTGNICAECGSLMMEGTKTIPERCSNRKCPNYNPHKKDGKLQRAESV